MRREEYLGRLEQLLHSIPREDREEAIRFYRDYLLDAGEEDMDPGSILGTPEELAKSIQQDLYGENADGSYHRKTADLPNVYSTLDAARGKFSNGSVREEITPNKEKRKQKLSAGQWILLVILLLCALPVILPVSAGLFGIVIALLAVILALVFGGGVAAAALLVAAVLIIIVALVKIIITPLSALIMFGGGLIMFGVALVGIALAAVIVFCVLPKVFVWIADILSRIFHR